jgi:O-antigen/teichoic acid export membrane protein
MAGFVLDKVMAAGQLMVVARLLMPEDFGLMAAVAVVMVTLLTLSELGLEQALLTRQEFSQQDMAVAWTLAVCRGTFLMLGVWICAAPLAAMFKTTELEPLLRAYAISLLIQSLHSPALAGLLKNLEHKRRVQFDLVRRAVETCVTIGLALWWRNVWALVGGQLAGFVVGSLLSYVIAPFIPRLSFSQPSRSYLLQYGRQVNRTTWLILGVTSGGEFVIGRLLGLEALGLYQIAMVLPLVLSTRLPLLMNQVSLPTYVLLERDRPAVVRGFLLQMVGMASVLGALSLGMAVWAPAIVEVIGGAKWAGAAGPLKILSLYAFCCGLSTLIGSLHYGLRRPDVQTKIWLVQFLVYAVVLVPFTAAAGLIGSAWALSFAYCIGLILHLYYTRILLLRRGETVVGLFRQEAPHLRGLLKGL